MGAQNVVAKATTYKPYLPVAGAFGLKPGLAAIIAFAALGNAVHEYDAFVAVYFFQMHFHNFGVAGLYVTAYE